MDGFELRNICSQGVFFHNCPTSPAGRFAAGLVSGPRFAGAGVGNSPPKQEGQKMSAVIKPTLELILGPMFSGKTTELFRRVKRHTAANRRCLLVRYSRDNRYSEEHAATHDREMMKASGTGALGDILALCDGYDVIGIDEGQFYPDLVEVVSQDLLPRGKIVIIAALDGDFQRRPFGRVLELVPLANRVKKCNAICSFCHDEAGSFTRRISSETELEVIGGADKYMSCCSVCYSIPLEQLVAQGKLSKHGETLARLSELTVK